MANHVLTKKLNDKSLLRSQAFVNGKWVNARSGKTFEVKGKSWQSTFVTRLVQDTDFHILRPCNK